MKTLLFLFHDSKQVNVMRQDVRKGWVGKAVVFGEIHLGLNETVKVLSVTGPAGLESNASVDIFVRGISYFDDMNVIDVNTERLQKILLLYNTDNIVIERLVL